jgi:hypothetical protein
MANPLQRLFGTRPRETLLRLVFLSILVGALLAIFRITPFELVDLVIEGVERLLSDHFRLIRDIFRYFVYGAMIVVPIWLILRMINAIR